MPRKAKSPSGTVEFVNKPEEAPAPSILPPKVDIPEQGTETSAPAPPAPSAPPAPPAPKAKRAYKKKNAEYWEAMKGSRKELLMGKMPTLEEDWMMKKEKPVYGGNEVVYPKEEPPAPPAPEKPARKPRAKKEKAPEPAPEPVPEPVLEKKKVGRPKKEKAPPAPKPPKPVKEKPVKPPKTPRAPPPRKARVYEPSSDEDEDESEDEEDSESEEEPEVEIIAKKAVRRIKTLEKIDKRIGQLKNPYSATNRFSVF